MLMTWDVEKQVYNVSDWAVRQSNKKLVEEYPFLLPRELSTDTISNSYDYQYTLLDDMPIGCVKILVLNFVMKFSKY